MPHDAERVTDTVIVDGDYPVQHPYQFYLSYPSFPQWRSTGLYAPAGEVVNLTFPDAVVGEGLQVRESSQPVCFIVKK